MSQELALGEIIRDIFEPKAAKLAQDWAQDIARTVDEACHLTPEEFGDLEIGPDDWEDVYKPALLWRFYRHIGAQLNRIGEGHAQVLLTTLKKEDDDGLGDSARLHLPPE